MKKKPILVFLSGFMGSGKTSVGKILARDLQIPFIDTDDSLVKHSGLSISELFQKIGERQFRKLETQIIASIKGPAVISLGGGALLSATNRKLIAQGIWIYLKTAPATLAERLKNDASRPLLNTANKRQTIEDLLRKRSPYYALAPYCLKTDGLKPQCIAQQIKQLLRKRS